MKKTLLFATLFVSVLLVSGCDFFRKIAGRPTSDEISAKLEALTASISVLQDGESTPDMSYNDSLIVMKALETNPEILMKANPALVKSGSGLDTDFCVMTGTFRKSSNADKLYLKARSAGYNAILIHYSNGLTAVGVEPTDNLIEAYHSLVRVLKEDFFPGDSWIIDNR